MNKKASKLRIKEVFLRDKKNKKLKEGKRERKALYKKASKADKKEARFTYKYYKKLKNRPIKLVIWALLILLIVLGLVKAGPVIKDARSLLSLEAASSDTAEATAARQAGEILAQDIADEGIVLLKNEDLLPLDNLKVNVFGYAALGFRHGGAGSGGADQSRAISFYDGLSNAGLQYNETLLDLYKGQNEAYVSENQNGLMEIIAGRFGEDVTLEPSIDYLTDEALAQAKSFSETAVIVLSNASTESADIELESLQLEQNQVDLIDRVASEFEQVIVIINAGNSMELRIVENYPSIKALLWVGTPGSKGTNSIGRILTGEVNPSGRITDTYVYDLTTHPSTVSYGDHPYSNIDKMAFINYNEGIYVGYRYFETIYNEDEEAYNRVVQFPFGYGLSYTEFDWQLVSHEFDADNMTLEVEVKNVGDVAGKDVVQLYFSPPYYPGGIEKSAIELAAYAKTEVIEPGQSEIVKLTFPTMDMSSYDMTDQEAFVLEAGTYEISLSKNVHESVEVLTYEVTEDVVYKEDPHTGTLIKNQFDYANGNLTYLSRNNWQGTYPSIDDLVFTADQEVVDAFYSRPSKLEGIEASTGVDHGMVLADLKDLAYDDLAWKDYLEQFTVEEMIEVFVTGGWRSIAVERLGLPQTLLLDGPAGINYFFGDVTSTSYPTEIVMASTWNDDLAYELGLVIGAEAKALGVSGWYAPGMNLHRMPNGGRNFEYYSEDPLLSGKMAANTTKGAQSNDIMVFVKHFAMNDVEMNARKGIMIWANEQAIRELYLRPFEIAVKEGQATAVMSSFSHLGPIWAGGNPELLEGVLREEWGFVGLVSSDAVQAHFMDPELSLRNGNDLMLNPLPSSQRKVITDLYEKDPVAVVNDLKDRIHNIAYSILNYTDLLD